MFKLNKSFIFLLIVVMVFGILSGCSGELPEGIDSSKFMGDMEDLYTEIDESIVDEDYHKDAIDLQIKKIEDSNYFKNLNEYELSIFILAKDILGDVENDLTTGNRIITSETFYAIEDIWGSFDK